MLVNIPILGEPILHSYSYDQLNRIKAVNNFNGYVSTTNSWTATDAHKETLSFDPNGNIQKALLNGPATNLPNEDFTYNYDPVKQNRLLSISNAVNNTVSNYTYNEIGEVTRDELQNNTYFQWTVYGKLLKLVKANGTHLSYTYSADGKRISKEVANSPTKGFREFYVRDASGNILATYQKDATVNGGHLSIKSFNMYGSNMIGTWDKAVDVETPSQPAVTAFIRGEQKLFVGNHLGNNMLVLTDRKNQHSSDGVTVDYYTPSVASATDYSAYGEDLIGREFNSNTISFGFNGKMNDAESGYQDYGMRVYDPVAHRFPTQDPLTYSYPYYTPYQFAGNSPILSVDIDGMEPSDNKNMSESLPSSKLVFGDNWATRTFDKTRNRIFDATEGVLDAGKDAVVGTVNFVRRDAWHVSTYKEVFKTSVAAYHNLLPKDVSDEYLKAWDATFGTDLLDRRDAIRQSFDVSKWSVRDWSKNITTLAITIFGPKVIKTFGGKAFGILSKAILANRITTAVFYAVSEHLMQFGIRADNAVMLERLQNIASGKMKATEIDLNFVKHELREAELMKDGLSYDKAHTQTLKEQGMYHRDYAKKLYTEDALKAGDAQDLNDAKH